MGPNFRTLDFSLFSSLVRFKTKLYKYNLFDTVTCKYLRLVPYGYVGYRHKAPPQQHRNGSQHFKTSGLSWSHISSIYLVLLLLTAECILMSAAASTHSTTSSLSFTSSESPPLPPQSQPLVQSFDSSFVDSSFSSFSSFPTLATESASLSPRTVTTKYGSIRGTIVRLSQRRTSYSSSSSSSNPQVSLVLSDIEAYLGVPYATPPTGGLRFMPPVTPTHWRGVRLANRFTPVCPQQISEQLLLSVRNESEALRRMPNSQYQYLRRLIPMLVNQSEDCLYLNIYTPVLQRPGGSSSSNSRGQQYSDSANGGGGSQLVPVVVLLHGESYDWNSGNVFDGSILAGYGKVLVVTLNYRLGIFGFLPAFVDGTVRGNYGLMDQVAALHWIQENIAEFGGLPSNVTIIGHGHGAACAHLLMLSPMAKGLFNRVVLMSGSALSPWAIARDPEYYATLLGKKLNCTNLESMIDCLRSRSISELVNVNLDVPDHLTSFGPIIDSIVVPLDPRRLYHTELYRHRLEPEWSSSNASLFSLVEQSMGRSYDLLLGATDFDAPCIFSESEVRFGVDPKRRDRILRTLVRNLYDYHQQAIFLTLFNEYSDWWESDNERSLDVLESTIAILSDSLVVAPLVQTADLHASQWSPGANSEDNSHNNNNPGQKSRTYFYMFSPNVKESAIYSQSRYFTDPQTDSQSNVNKQRPVCSSGQDLAYLFGDPIAHFLPATSSSSGSDNGNRVGPFEYGFNLTKNHLLISEMFIQYVVNFVRYGDPNTRSSTSNNPRHQFSSKSPSYMRSLWPKYDSQQKNYISLGSTIPKTQDHHQNHRLSLWLNLIPRLLMDDRELYSHNIANLSSSSDNHQLNSRYGQIPLLIKQQLLLMEQGRSSGQSSHSHKSNSMSNSNGQANGAEPYSQQQQQLYRQHHLLLDYENPKSFDGVVRVVKTETLPQVDQKMKIGSQSNKSISTLLSTTSHAHGNNGGSNNGQQGLTTMSPSLLNASNGPLNLTTTSSSSSGTGATGSSHIYEQQHRERIMESGSPLLFLSAGDYSNALLVTIGIGCSLLLFNVLIFAALYFQLSKNRKLVAAQQQQQQQQKPDSNNKSSESDQKINSSNGKESILDPTCVVLSSPIKYRDRVQLSNLDNSHQNDRFDTGINDINQIQINTNSLSRGNKNRALNYAPYTVYPPTSQPPSSSANTEMVNLLAHNEQQQQQVDYELRPSQSNMIHYQPHKTAKSSIEISKRLEAVIGYGNGTDVGGGNNEQSSQQSYNNQSIAMNGQYDETTVINCGPAQQQLAENWTTNDQQQHHNLHRVSSLHGHQQAGSVVAGPIETGLGNEIDLTTSYVPFMNANQPTSYFCLMPATSSSSQPQPQQQMQQPQPQQQMQSQQQSQQQQPTTGQTTYREMSV